MGICEANEELQALGRAIQLKPAQKLVIKLRMWVSQQCRSAAETHEQGVRVNASIAPAPRYEVFHHLGYLILIHASRISPVGRRHVIILGVFIQIPQAIRHA